MRAAFIKALTSYARSHPNLWLLTADLGYSFLEPFAQEFPERFVNVGIAEQNMMSLAAGLALTGKKVVVYSIINFATFRCLEQIRNDICYHHLDVMIVGVGAGYFYGSQGYSHHCIEDIAIMRALPHMQIYAPIHALHTQWLTHKLLMRSGPIYLRLGRNRSSDEIPSELFLDSAMLLRHGKEVLLIALGEAAMYSMSVADQLQQKGIFAGVMTFSQIAPLDEEALVQAAKNYPLWMIIEEHRIGGLATSIAEIMMKRQLYVAVKVIRLPEEPVSIGGSSDELLKSVGLAVESIVQDIEGSLR